MKLDIKTLSAKLKPWLVFARSHFKLIFILGLVGTYSFLVVRIGMLSKIEPTDDQVEQVLKDVKKPRIDKAALAKIQQLEDQNVQVQTLFKQARDNPFSE